MRTKRLVSHFFPWAATPDQMFDFLMAEFVCQGATHLTIGDDSSLRFLTDEAHGTALYACAKRHGLKLHDAHAPFHSRYWDLNVEDTEQRKKLVTAHIKCLENFAPMGVKTYTIHIGASVCFDKKWLGREDHYRSLACKTLEQLLPIAEKLGVIIAVENSFEPSNAPSEVLYYMKQFDSPALGCCFDAGHAHLTDVLPDRPEEAINEYLRVEGWCGKSCLCPHALEMLAPHIVTCHLHDNDATSDQHRMVFDGTANWAEYMQELARCPRLISIQDEGNFVSAGIPISKVCATFDRLLELMPNS